jgi:hypothetical protein
VPDALVSRAALDRIRQLARRLPGQMTVFFGFECPLSGEAARADFLTCSTRDEGHSKVIAGLDPDHRLPSSFYDEAAWQAVRRFCLEWEDPASPLRAGVLNCWLEFDMDRLDLARPCPSFFFGAQPRGEIPAGSPSQCELTEHCLGLLSPGWARADQTAALRRCFEALPEGAEVFQVGLMLASPTDAVRVCVRSLAPAAVGAYLSNVGWRGDVAALEALVWDLDALSERVDFDLAVAAQVGPSVGLECYPGADARAGTRLRSIASELVDRGLCTPAKGEALFDYCGIAHERTAPEAWSEPLKDVSALLGPQYLSVHARFVHHLKVVFEHGAAARAKGYLGVRADWIDVPRFLALQAAAAGSQR